MRLLTVPVEGKLVRGFEGVDVGDRIRVQLVSVDVERGFIDFLWSRIIRSIDTGAREAALKAPPLTRGPPVVSQYS